MPMLDTALVVMARYPEKGKTKTRLAQVIGHETVLQLYRAFLIDLAQRFAGSPYALHWTFTPAEVDYAAFIANIASLAPPLVQQMHSFPQQGPELGARLLHAFTWTYERGYQYIIVISSDSPQISMENVAQARAQLDNADVVLGPTDDGGYYLIAMRKPHDVFTGIPMSTSIVTQKTVEQAQHQNLTVQLIDPLFDVDELPDLLRLRQLLAVHSERAPATAAELATMKI